MNDLTNNPHGDALDRISREFGISLDYADVWGERHAVPTDTKRQFLDAMGVRGPDDADRAAAAQAFTQRAWREPLLPVYVLRAGAAPVVTVTLPARLETTRRWRLTLESGVQSEGEFDPGGAEVLERRSIDNIDYVRYHWTLPAALALGYHQLSFDGAPKPTLLVIAPDRCYEPEVLAQGNRVWGFAVQLYALRSARNWGIGDFGDLREFVAHCAGAGAALVGLNPLHALFPHNAEHASPYSPSSRLFLNMLYIDVEAIPEFSECEAARRTVAAPAFQAALAQLRARDTVDYRGVAARKREILELLYSDFRERHLAVATPTAKAFREFQLKGSAALERHAIYEALQEHLHSRDASLWGWPVWPQEYRRPEAPAVAEFARAQRERVEFFQYTQWQADRQLQRAAAAAEGLAIGLYRDLAVGVDRGGAEAWGNQDLYALDVSVGCPPDDFNLHGQNWGLPPMLPSALRAQAYAPYIATLRANMRYAGALRIDHVMGLLRLFWVPPGARATVGTYVQYPMDDLLGILALESQRQRCMVIGEDLGTVPDEIRVGLRQLGVLSYRLFYFERSQNGDFKPPREYIEAATVAVTTHDLATLAGFWTGQDLTEKHGLGLFPSEEMYQRQVREREQDRRRLLQALAREQLLPSTVDAHAADPPPMSPALAAAIHTYLARTPAKILLVQVEDVLGQAIPVNLPGTSTERANWRLKLGADLDTLFASPGLAELSARLRAEGRGGA